MNNTNDDRWYRDGLRFECTQCGRCCTGTSGYVWVSMSEARAIAARLGVSLDEFGRRYLRRVGQRYSLLEDADTGSCVFLEDNRCRIHEHRPAQCRRFPFWPVNLVDAAAWSAAAEECEGINDEAALVDAREVERLRRG